MALEAAVGAVARWGFDFSDRGEGFEGAGMAGGAEVGVFGWFEGGV